MAMTWALETPGRVAYVALNDGTQKARQRMRELGASEAEVAAIVFADDFPPWPGALEHVRPLLEDRPTLLVLDPIGLEHEADRYIRELSDNTDVSSLSEPMRRLAEFAPPRPRPWEDDYEAVRQLHEAALDLGVAVLVVYGNAGEPSADLVAAVGTVDRIGPDLQAKPAPTSMLPMGRPFSMYPDPDF